MMKKEIITIYNTDLTQMQRCEKKHFKKVMRKLQIQIERITKKRKAPHTHSYNDFLNDMGCYFISKVNKWINEV